MCPKDASGMANSIDPDQTAPWSGSTLFTQTCLFEYMHLDLIFDLIYGFTS